MNDTGSVSFLIEPIKKSAPASDLTPTLELVVNDALRIEDRMSDLWQAWHAFKFGPSPDSIAADPSLESDRLHALDTMLNRIESSIHNLTDEIRSRT